MNSIVIIVELPTGEIQRALVLRTLAVVDFIEMLKEKHNLPDKPYEFSLEGQPEPLELTKTFKDYDIQPHARFRLVKQPSLSVATSHPPSSTVFNTEVDFFYSVKPDDDGRSVTMIDTVEEQVINPPIQIELQIPGFTIDLSSEIKSGTARLFQAHPLPPEIHLPPTVMVKCALTRLAIKLLRNEAAILSELKLPHAPRVFPLPGTNDQYIGYAQWQGEEYGYILLEYLPGKTLVERTKERRFTGQEICQFLTSIAETLDVMHNKGWAHLDLSPANIIVCDNGECFLIDFGTCSPLHQPVLVDGKTRYFAAPERSTNYIADSSGDIYALGAIAVSMLLNQPLDRLFAPNEEKLLGSSLTRRAVVGLPEAVQLSVSRLCNIVPSNRPGTAEEVIEVLERTAILLDIIQSRGYHNLKRIRSVTQGWLFMSALINILVIVCSTLLLLCAAWLTINYVIPMIHIVVLVLDQQNLLFPLIFLLLIVTGVGWIIWKRQMFVAKAKEGHFQEENLRYLLQTESRAFEWVYETNARTYLVPSAPVQTSVYPVGSTVTEI